MIEEIKQLKELLDMGAITQEEYERKKTEILDSPPTGQQVSSPAPPQAIYQQNHTAPHGEKSKIAAGLLAILLGSLGIHKFYLGYTKTGIIMLVATVLGSVLFFIIPLAMGIISLVEGIIYLTKSDDDFAFTYVQNEKEWF